MFLIEKSLNYLFYSMIQNNLLHSDVISLQVMFEKGWGYSGEWWFFIRENKYVINWSINEIQTWEIKNWYVGLNKQKQEKELFIMILLINEWWDILQRLIKLSVINQKMNT